MRDILRVVICVAYATTFVSSCENRSSIIALTFNPFVCLFNGRPQFTYMPVYRALFLLLLSRLLKSIWLFFPGILFLVRWLYGVFWKLGQGKSFIVALQKPPGQDHLLRCHCILGICKWFSLSSPTLKSKQNYITRLSKSSF